MAATSVSGSLVFVKSLYTDPFRWFVFLYYFVAVVMFIFEICCF